jgi:hypothetical protein
MLYIFCIYVYIYIYQWFRVGGSGGHPTYPKHGNYMAHMYMRRWYEVPYHDGWVL